jgi:septal ring factor EnvC (AmiA/AmiB activator)
MTLPKFNAESLGFVVTVLFVLASISASYGVSQHQLNRHEAKLAEVEERINQNENLLIEIANDVRWIREQISRQAQK